MVPLALLAAGAAAVASSLHTPERLDPARAWCGPSVARPLGCGEGGVDLLAVVAHAELRGVALAIGVALIGLPEPTTGLTIRYRRVSTSKMLF